MTDAEKYLTPEEREGLDELSGEERAKALERIKNNEPSAYVFGRKYFFKNYFSINKDCLIPRPDTERVVEHCLDVIKDVKDPLIADLCAGCGIIGLTLLDERRDASAHLYEISQGALDMARLNAKSLGCLDRAVFFPLDLMKADELHGTYDLIVSNPPYITDSEMEELDKSVREFEPRGALAGGADGLDFYRAILENWLSVLKDGGVLAFECGIAQASALEAICREYGMKSIQTTRDTSGANRVVSCIK